MKLRDAFLPGRSASARVGQMHDQAGRATVLRSGVPDSLRRPLIWVLILALAIYALSGGILRTVGPKHWHAGASMPPQIAKAAGAFDPVLLQASRWFASLQALADAAHARAHALGAAPHHHSHSAVLRHWHDPADDSVQWLGDQAANPELADLKAAAAIGGATLILALATHEAWRLLARANGRWPHATVPSWHSVSSPPPIEPPIA